MIFNKPKAPKPLPLDLKQVLADTAIDTARDLMKDQVKKATWEPDNLLLATLLQEVAAQFVGKVGRLIIAVVLRSVDDTRHRLKIVEGDIRFLMWEPIFDGAQIALEEINTPLSEERQPFRDGRLHTALGRLGQAKRHYDHLGIKGDAMFDLKLLIAFVTLQTTGGRSDARKLFQDLASEIWPELNETELDLVSARENVERLTQKEKALEKWLMEYRDPEWAASLPEMVYQPPTAENAQRGSLVMDRGVNRPMIKTPRADYLFYLKYDLARAAGFNSLREALNWSEKYEMKKSREEIEKITPLVERLKAVIAFLENVVPASETRM